jgi:rare lipoprotein A
MRCNIGWLAASFLSVVIVISGSGCATGGGGRQDGLASYYADSFHGRKTASGEMFDRGALTAAHRTLPFGTRVRVTNQDNRKSVVVRITDRGPFVKGRVIDLSPAAARQIDMIRAGIVPVELEVLSGGEFSRGD